MKKSFLPLVSAIITVITVLLYVAILFINGIIFSSEQQPIIVFISGVTVFSIFANMVSYWSLAEQTTLENDEIKKANEDYDDYVRDNIKDTFDFELVINEQYNANKRLQYKQDIYKRLLSRSIKLKWFNYRINVILPKIKFLETTKYYRNKDKIILKLKSKLETLNYKKDMLERRLDMKSATLSIAYKRVVPQSIFSRNGHNDTYANGVNKLAKHKTGFMITRIVFSGITTFFPILFVFSINGIINTSYIIPIAMGLGAVIITILQTLMFARRYTKYDTLDYLNDLFYICKWYVSFRLTNPIIKQQPKSISVSNNISDKLIFTNTDNTLNLNDELKKN